MTEKKLRGKSISSVVVESKHEWTGKLRGSKDFGWNFWRQLNLIKGLFDLQWWKIKVGTKMVYAKKAILLTAGDAISLLCFCYLRELRILLNIYCKTMLYWTKNEGKFESSWTWISSNWRVNIIWKTEISLKWENMVRTPQAELLAIRDYIKSRKEI